MAGYIRRRGKGSWEVTKDLGRDPTTGRRGRQFVNVKGRKRDAERVLAEALHERDTGIDIAPGKLTVADYLRRWLRDYASHNVAPTTLRGYTSIVEQHFIPALGSIRLADLRPSHIQAAYGRALERLSPRTLLRHHGVLHEALRHAVRWQLVSRNPVDAVTPPRPERSEMQVLDSDQAAALLGVADGHYALIYVALATGARQGELLALRWEDIDGDTLRITRTARRLPGQGITYGPPKTARSVRPVALSPNTVKVLREHRAAQVEYRLSLGPAYADHGLVFPSATGRPTDDSNLRQTFRRLLRQAELPAIRFHDLRHTAATLMLRSGVHPKVVSERLGHATVSITLDTYSHVTPDMQREAAEALDAVLP